MNCILGKAIEAQVSWLESESDESSLSEGNSAIVMRSSSSSYTTGLVHRLGKNLYLILEVSLDYHVGYF